MGKEKLIALGWIDAQGHSITWSDWQQRKKTKHSPVSYWKDVDSGKLTPISNVLAGYKVHKEKAS